MRRAGWLTLGLIAIPGKLRRWIFPTWTRFFVSMGLGAVVTGIGSCTYNEYKKTLPATPEQILQYTKNNWCVSELLPRRAAQDDKIKTQQAGVIELGDLISAKDDCIIAQEKGRVAGQQIEALNKAKAAAGVK